ncbi:hemicentin-1-like [Anneissia japonica]|uniref:hemicentin-1-like n=1 Tax=Anneissia japonica TaxID=1529436 RepID=UPI001425860C|nr:hemicentin-1-like [Anneissia japonica]
MSDIFWRRWTREYLPSLQQRQKWNKITDSELSYLPTMHSSVFCVCSAVIVTVSINGNAVEDKVTRLDCTIQKTDLTNTNIPFISWQEVVNGSPVTIVQYQNAPGAVQPPYDDRFSIEGNDTILALVIDKANRKDSGTYRCEVRIVGDALSPASGTVTITVDYLEPPGPVEPTEKYVSPKDFAIFTCPSPDGVPTPITITWIKDGGVLDVSDTEKYPQSDTILEIRKVNENDEGDYQCKAENAAFSGDEGKLSNNGTLSVANITVEPCLQKIFGSASLECVTNSLPTPMIITWIKDGNVLNVSDTDKYPQSETTLIISDTRKEDEGKYQCRAQYAVNSGDEQTLLSINEGILLYGNVTVEPRSLTVEKSNCASFKCVTKSPPITITWFKDGSTLNVSNTKKYPLSDTRLIIIDVIKEDEGKYQCEAEYPVKCGNERSINEGILLLGSIHIVIFWTGGILEFVIVVLWIGHCVYIKADYFADHREKHPITQSGNIKIGFIICGTIGASIILAGIIVVDYFWVIIICGCIVLTPSGGYVVYVKVGYFADHREKHPFAQSVQIKIGFIICGTIGACLIVVGTIVVAI